MEILSFYTKKVDYESLAEKTFELEVQARQKDNPLKSATATVRNQARGKE